MLERLVRCVWRTPAARVLLCVLTGVSPALAEPRSDPKPPSAPFEVPDWPLLEDRSPAEIDKAVRDHMQQGAERLRKNDLEGARAEFLNAWDLKPLVAVAYSLAAVEMRVGRYRDAAEHWDHVLENLSESRAADRAAVEAHLAECRKHIGNLRVSVNTPHAIVWVGKRVVVAGENGQASVWVDPGTHTLSAQRDARTSPKTTISIGAGETKSVSLELQAPPAVMSNPAPVQKEPARPAPVRDAPAERGIPTRTLVVIGGGVLTAGALTTSLVYALKANAAEDDARELLATVDQTRPDVPAGQRCNPGQTRPAECDDLRAKNDERVRAANIGNAALATSAVLGAATVAAFLFWPDDKPASQRHGQITLSPWPFGRPRGLALDVTF